MKKVQTNKRRKRPSGQSYCSLCLEPIVAELSLAWSMAQDYIHSCGRRIPPYKVPGQ